MNGIRLRRPKGRRLESEIQREVAKIILHDADPNLRYLVDHPLKFVSSHLEQKYSDFTHTLIWRRIYLGTFILSLVVILTMIPYLSLRASNPDYFSRAGTDVLVVLIVLDVLAIFGNFAYVCVPVVAFTRRYMDISIVLLSSFIVICLFAQNVIAIVFELLEANQVLVFQFRVILYALVTNFVFLVKTRISRWYHILGSLLTLMAPIIRTQVTPPINVLVFLHVEMWTETASSVIILLSSHIGAYLLESQNRILFYNFWLSSSEVAQQQERAVVQREDAMTGLERLTELLTQTKTQLEKAYSECGEIGGGHHQSLQNRVLRCRTMQQKCLRLVKTGTHVGGFFTEQTPKDMGLWTCLLYRPDSTQALRQWCSEKVSSVRPEAVKETQSPELIKLLAERRRDMAVDKTETVRIEDMVPQREEEMLRLIGKEWNVDMLELNDKSNGKALIVVGWRLLEPFVNSGILLVESSTVANFLGSIRSTYHNNIYHNQLHAAQMCHLAVMLSRMVGLSIPSVVNYDDAEEGVICWELNLLVASIGHDADHRGRTNSFCVYSCDATAMVYNDYLVLENYHCYLTFDVLSQVENNIFLHWSSWRYRTTRKRIIELILSTDMTMFLPTLSNLRARRFESDFNPWINETDASEVSKTCMILAEMGYSCLPWDQSYAWALCLHEELYLQGDQEKQLGLPVEPICDRQFLPNMFVAQQTLLKNIIMPIFDELQALEISTSNLGEHIRVTLIYNLQRWIEWEENNSNEGYQRFERCKAQLMREV
eukprot:GHVQ01026340.1.p1 GENE.GHVQ01026340.1~~GHVQ01026340.1.p1  ORF type:complete len:769 (+),score=75.75 GHVQ01026340.1:216-2522(+)